MSQEQYNENMSVIGEYVTKVNSLEFILNTLVEQIILNKNPQKEDSAILHSAIDNIQDQAVKARVNFIITLLLITKPSDLAVKFVMEKLKNFSLFYAKDVYNLRNFIAHNPTFKGDIYTVISSKRFKKGMNSKKISDIKNEIEKLDHWIEELIQLFEILQQIYPAKVLREFTNNSMSESKPFDIEFGN